MQEIKRASRIIAASSALIMGAGAGMGVDSGLPDFRGDEGFWKAYPPLKHLGISFVEMANPAWFERDPRLAWGFYGHRMNLYRSVTPHPGYEILKCWAASNLVQSGSGAFIFTSNVDGQFQKAGFGDREVLECHGSLHYLQCTGHCQEIWSAQGVDVEVDESSMKAVGDLPRCPSCGELARPNILMFGDWAWNGAREESQNTAFQKWLSGIHGPVALLECGAGSAVPTVRLTMEHLARQLKGTLIRINLREPEVPRGHIGLAMGAREALERIDQELSGGIH